MYKFCSSASQSEMQALKSLVFQILFSFLIEVSSLEIVAFSLSHHSEVINSINFYLRELSSFLFLSLSHAFLLFAFIKYRERIIQNSNEIVLSLSFTDTHIHLNQIWILTFLKFLSQFNTNEILLPPSISLSLLTQTQTHMHI